MLCCRILWTEREERHIARSRLRASPRLILFIKNILLNPPLSWATLCLTTQPRELEDSHNIITLAKINDPDFDCLIRGSLLRQTVTARQAGNT